MNFKQDLFAHQLECNNEIFEVKTSIWSFIKIQRGSIIKVIKKKQYLSNVILEFPKIWIC